MRVHAAVGTMLRAGLPALALMAFSCLETLCSRVDAASPGFRGGDEAGLPDLDQMWRTEAAAPSPEERAWPTVPDSVRDAVSRWIGDLDGERFQSRRQAARNLVRSGAAAIAPLSAAAAAGGSLEVGQQAVNVLQELCLSSDSRTEEAARDALVQLAQGKHRAVALQAAAALRTQRTLLHQRAVTRLRRMGGTVEVYESPDGDYTSTTVLLGRDWRGREAGLAHFKDLLGLERAGLKGRDFTDASLKFLQGIPELRMVQLYGTRVTDDGEQSLRQSLPAANIDRRDGALLGVSGSAGLQGCQIEYVLPDSAANRAGLEVGDVIMKFDDHPVQDFPGLTSLIARKKPGDKAALQVLRGEDKLDKEVLFGELELDSFQ